MKGTKPDTLRIQEVCLSLVQPIDHPFLDRGFVMELFPQIVVIVIDNIISTNTITIIIITSQRCYECCGKF